MATDETLQMLLGHNEEMKESLEAILARANEFCAALWRTTSRI
jgi:hypothetical protein